MNFVGMALSILGMYVPGLSYVVRDGTNRNETVRYKVLLDGNLISQKEKQGCVRISVSDSLDKVGMCELVFMRKTKEQKYKGIDWSAMKIGSEVKVSVGGSPKWVFVGKVSGMREAWKDGKDQLSLVCFDPTAHMASSRKTRFWENVTDSDIMKEVIPESGPVGRIDDTTKVYDYIMQRNESDYNFIKRLASRNGFLLKANEGKIDCCKPEFPTAWREIEFFQMRDFDCERQGNEVPTELHVLGWNAMDKKQVKATAGSGDIQKIGGGDDAVTATAGQVWKEVSYVVDAFVQSDEEALEVAKADINRIARGFVRGKAVIQGDGQLMAGQKVKFPKLPNGHKAEVVVISAEQQISEGAGGNTVFHFVGNTAPV